MILGRLKEVTSLLPKDGRTGRRVDTRRPWLQRVLRMGHRFTVVFLLVMGSVGTRSAGSFLCDISQSNSQNRKKRAEAKNQTTSLESEVAAATKSGTILLEQRDWPGAQKAFEKAIRHKPDSVEGHSGLGLSFLRQGDLVSAKKQFETVQHLDPKFPDGYFNLATVLIEEQQYSQAMWQLIRATELKPDHIPAIGALSFVYDRQGDTSSAIALLEKAISFKPTNPELYEFLGGHQYKAKQYQAAVKSFGKAIELNPKSHGAHYGLGLALLALDPDNGPEAERKFETALQTEPRNAEALYQLGTMAAKEGQLEKAVSYLQKAVSLQPKLAEAHSELAKVYQQQEEFQSAEKAFRTAIRCDPQLVQAFFGLASLLQSMGQKEAARPYLEEFNRLQEIKRKSQRATLLKGDGLRALQEGRFEEAAKILKECLALDPTAGDAVHLLGVTLAQQGKMAEATEAFKTALRLRPGFARAQLDLAIALKSTGDPAAEEEMKKAEALRSLFSTQAASQLSADVEAAAVDKYNFAVSLLQQGNQSQAAEAFQAVVRLNPKMAEPHFALGVIRTQQGDTARAKEEFYTVQRLDPQFVDSYNNLGTLLVKEKNYSEAMWQFLDAIRLNPKHTQAQVNLSMLLTEQGNPEAAVAQLVEAVRLSPANATLFLQLGRAQNRVEQYTEAAVSFRKALQLNPQLSSAHDGLGIALLALGQTSEGNQEIETCLRDDPNNAEAHYHLGESWLQQNQLEQGIVHLQQAVRFKPEFAEAHALLGKAYSQQGKSDQAEKELRVAISLNPSLVQAYYSLASLFRDAGRLEEANRYFEDFNKIQSQLRDKHNVPALNNEGLKLKMAGRWEEAAGTFQKALSIDPSAAAVHYNLGTVFAKQGKLQEATDSYRAAIQLRPGFVQAQEALALTLKSLKDPTAEEELHKAELLKKLVPLAPVSPNSN